MTTIACWQAAVRSGDVRAMLTALSERAALAAAEGASLLVTPEMSLTGYHLGPDRLAELAEPAGGALCTAVAEIAAEHGVAITFGWPEVADGVIYNAAQVVDATGAVLATYRKAHLFGEIDRSAFGAGDTGVVQATVDGLRIGVLICYDVEFPEAVRAHALAGTELLVVPTALMRPWDFVARILVPTRAFENQMFLAYTNWVGREQQLEYCGSSRVVGPDGAVLGELGEEESLLLVDVDPKAIERARAETPYLTDRRPDLYV